MDDWLDIEKYESIFYDDPDWEFVESGISDPLDYPTLEETESGLDPQIEGLRNLVGASPELRLIIDRLVPILEEKLVNDNFEFDYKNCSHGASGGTIEHYKSLNRFAFDLKFVPMERELRPGVDGEMNPLTGIITISPHLSLSNKIKTMSHELAHAILHSDPIKSWDKEEEQLEVEAESVALLVCEHIGVDTNFSSELYILNWMNSGGYVPSVLFSTIEDDVVKTFNQIKQGIFTESKDIIDSNSVDNL